MCWGACGASEIPGCGPAEVPGCELPDPDSGCRPARAAIAARTMAVTSPAATMARLRSVPSRYHSQRRRRRLRHEAERRRLRPRVLHLPGRVHRRRDRCHRARPRHRDRLLGSAYVTGVTASANFPITAGAIDTSVSNNDAFVTKLNTAGSGLLYSTYLGGSANEGGWGIALDSTQAAHVVGRSNSTNFPTTAGAYDTTANGGNDAFVTKLNAAGSALGFSTYLGGSADEGVGDGTERISIALDSLGAPLRHRIHRLCQLPHDARRLRHDVQRRRRCRRHRG